MQEIEIEFKNLLTEFEYERILKQFPFPEPIKQVNYYFETENFSLKDHGAALRIREKNGSYRLTLKEPHPNGLLETHDLLTKEEARSWINGKCIAKENTTKQLEKFSISPQDFIYYGSLITLRREFQQGGVLYVLDYSTYNNEEDYELELEATDRDSGLDAFNSLLHELKIPVREPNNKIQRFFASLNQ